MRLRKSKSIKRAFAMTLCFALAVPVIGPVTDVSAATPAPNYVKNHDQYTMIWNDEFNGVKHWCLAPVFHFLTHKVIHDKITSV